MHRHVKDFGVWLGAVAFERFRDAGLALAWSFGMACIAMALVLDF